MSGCPGFEELSAHVDGGLSPAGEAAVRRHLKSCVACRREVDGLTALKRAVGRAYGCDAPAPALRRMLTPMRSKRRRMP